MGVTARPVSLDDLIRLGAGDIAHYLERDRPPCAPLEWLGIAVGHLPELSARARTADEVHLRSRTQSVAVRTSLIDAVTGALAHAAALVGQARDRLLDRYPEAGAGDTPTEDYADLLEAAHRSAPRHAEMMVAGYAAFLGGAIEAAGCLAEGELEIARAGRWERVDHEQLVEVRAAQLHAALSNALGALLAYARLIVEDAARLRG